MRVEDREFGLQRFLDGLVQQLLVLATVTESRSRTMARLPEQLRRSLTRDRGMELANHKTVTADTVIAAKGNSRHRKALDYDTRLLRRSTAALTV